MSTPALVIRDATRGDLADITSLVSALNREEGYDISASAQALHEVLFEGNPRVAMRALVAQKGVRIIGLALYYWGYDTVSATYGYHLADIVIDTAHRRQGIGSQLFNALGVQCLREQGKWISLTVLRQNARAQAFYTSRGMVEVAVNFYAIGPQALARCAQL